ncbi:putative DNA modification/repair radical SAM protein [Hansschlegelia zhihuaiae]|uniref:Putative DNA modification/repair radical SAM protein n=1 Tax=Hansschlegelia zhihuaiae TaxID=405005 RepID=A0A4Q0MP57_9HYPH|nr:putative DNA modification/repair radical SAM protein [Hansschlegelia zhihuaiae]RXF75677.1 putative DNA modification/repair radical SAM protein [Hansschlegelia zhihuaiae]
MDLSRKLAILADAAKYDASCASSGTTKRHSAPTRGGPARGFGSTEGAGICHSYAPDGRCISLLKVLLTNACAFDCLYCVNRASSNTPRARFSVEEVVGLTLDFYRRNYIEGLFLSSGVIRSPDYTMEQVVRVARSLRLDHGFRGYIHLKTIPDASPELISQAGLFADRLSINVELPTDASLKALAPEKDARAVRRTMAGLRTRIEEAQAEKKSRRFAPAGQSTQMIVGADASDDREILETSANLYAGYRLKRVYYSAFSPIPEPSAALPLQRAPLMREHRLYQADWLMRFYGFSVQEITEGGGMLDLRVDPKLAWALRNRGRFPIDVARASREELLRVPGLGKTTVDRILSTRRFRAIRSVDLARLRVSVAKVAPFLKLADHTPSIAALDRERLLEELVPSPRQMALAL